MGSQVDQRYQACHEIGNQFGRGEPSRVAHGTADAVGTKDGESGLVFARIPAGATYKEKAYSVLKEAIVNLDVYGSPEPIMLDERELSDRLGVSRTPIREALAVLHQEGFVRIAPRRGIVVVRKTRREIVQMIQAWAALESMAARLITRSANDEEIATLRGLFTPFGRIIRPSRTWTSIPRPTSRFIRP